MGEQAIDFKYFFRTEELRRLASKLLLPLYTYVNRLNGGDEYEALF
jgi:hypothetical protein